MTLSPKLGVVGISTLWYFRLPLPIQMFIKVASSPRLSGIGMPSPILWSHPLKMQRIALLSSLLWWELGTNSLITGPGEWLSFRRFTSKLSWSWSSASFEIQPQLTGSFREKLRLKHRSSLLPKLFDFAEIFRFARLPLIRHAQMRGKLILKIFGVDMWEKDWKILTLGSTVPVENEACRVSYWNGEPSGWDFPVSTEHQWWTLFVFLCQGKWINTMTSQILFINDVIIVVLDWHSDVHAL